MVMHAQRFALHKNLWGWTKMADEIIEELWKIKDGIAREYGYNVDALVAHLKTKGRSAGQKAVDLRTKKTSGQKGKTKKQRHKIAEQGA